MSVARNSHLGSTLDDFLEDEGVLPEAHAIAIKRVIVWQVKRIMEIENLNKSEIARRMNTSRAALNRLLDPENPSVTLLTLDRVAAVLGKRLKVELIDELTPA